jgi:hypothetical protein
MNGKYRGCLKIDELTYERLREQFATIAAENALQEQAVAVVSARTLKPVESIGNPEREDFPLVKGREIMVEADFKGAKGQAFTDMPGDFQGTVSQILKLDLGDNFERAVFIASFNAVLRHLQCLEGTIHCKDQEPEECAQCLVDYVREQYGSPKIAFIGLQPAMVDHLARHFEMRVTDMDPDNQGQTKYGVPIEPVDHTQEVIEWGDVVFATGSTVVNNTYRSLLQDRPLVFYGVTVSGVAYLTDCPQYCHSGH